MISRGRHIEIPASAIARTGRLMTAADGRPVGLAWNYSRGELVADAVIHVTGAALGIAGAAVMVAQAAGRVQPVEFAAIAVYLAGLLAMLGLSGAYNMWPVSPAKWLLRRFDHAAIYVMIAGTYTPFLTRLNDAAIAAGLFLGLWGVAAVGVVVKLVWPGRFDRLSILLYLLLGWSGVIVYDAVAGSLPASTIGLLAAGGVLYSAGVVFHVWTRLPFQNAIRHAFVLVAAALHYGAVRDCFLPPGA